jgi:hypothetical protein
MQQILELGAKDGERDELALDGFKQEVLAFIRRVVGIACGRPEAEVKGNLALLALVVEDILSQAAIWQTSLGEMLAQVQNQREQEVFSDLCPEGASAHGGRGQGVPCRASPVSSPRIEQRGAEATEPSWAAAAVGSWRLVDDRWKPKGAGGSQIPGEAVGHGGPEAPCDECQPCLTPHRSWETAPRAEGPSHVASVQAVEAASILRFLSEAEWRGVR